MHQNVAFMKSLLLIFLGGGTGSVLRYLLTISIYRQGATNFPWVLSQSIFWLHTYRVFYTLTSRIHINNDIRLMLTIGLCGGFTTFSTFQQRKVLQLLKSGLYPSFFTYIISSVVLGILGVMLGIWMSE